jgi:putative membrane protein
MVQPSEIVEVQMFRRIFAVLAMSGMIYSAHAASPEDDATFLKTAIGIDLAEIDAGNLAQKNGSTDAVKQFGAMLVTDHTKDRDVTTGLAKKMSIEVPSAPSTDDQATARRLSALSGADFDKAFADAMVKGHKAAIALYTDKSGDSNSSLASYARDTLPTLQKHLDEATRLSSP